MLHLRGRLEGLQRRELGFELIDRTLQQGSGIIGCDALPQHEVRLHHALREHALAPRHIHSGYDIDPGRRHRGCVCIHRQWQRRKHQSCQEPCAESESVHDNPLQDVKVTRERPATFINLYQFKGFNQHTPNAFPDRPGGGRRNGRWPETIVLDASPSGRFEDSAVKAFRDARFVPAQRNGRLAASA